MYVFCLLIPTEVGTHLSFYCIYQEHEKIAIKNHLLIIRIDGKKLCKFVVTLNKIKVQRFTFTGRNFSVKKNNKLFYFQYYLKCTYKISHHFSMRISWQYKLSHTGYEGESKCTWNGTLQFIMWNCLFKSDSCAQNNLNKKLTDGQWRNIESFSIGLLE